MALGAYMNLWFAVPKMLGLAVMASGVTTGAAHSASLDAQAVNDAQWGVKGPFAERTPLKMEDWPAPWISSQAYQLTG